MTGPDLDPIDDPDDRDDDWYDVRDPLDGYVREEPDCPPCCDTGYLDDGRNCPGCNPTRWQYIVWVWWYRLRRLATPIRWCRRRLRRRGPDSEPPF